MGRNSHYAPYTAAVNATVRPTARNVFKGTGIKEEERIQSVGVVRGPLSIHRNSVQRNCAQRSNEIETSRAPRRTSRFSEQGIFISTLAQPASNYSGRVRQEEQKKRKKKERKKKRNEYERAGETPRAYAPSRVEKFGSLG